MSRQAAAAAAGEGEGGGKGGGEGKIKGSFNYCWRFFSSGFRKPEVGNWLLWEEAVSWYIAPRVWIGIEI